MKDLKDEIIIKLLKEVEELKEMQTISKSNQDLFSELYNKLGGSAKFREINTNLYCETFPDRFLILVDDYINTSKEIDEVISHNFNNKNGVNNE